MVRLILAIAFLFALFWAYKRWQALPPKERKSALLHGLIYGALGFCILAVLTGRIHWFGAVIGGALALARFGIRALPLFKILGRNSIFGNPVFKTPFVEVQINLQNGNISGKIIRGLHEGLDITTLTDEQLHELENYYQERDKRSFYLIRVLRQRAGQQFKSDANYSSVGDPSVEEAHQILGVQKGASKKDIIKAHRSLMQKLHPDRGGNDYLAARVNIAKEILLKHLQ